MNVSDIRSKIHMIDLKRKELVTQLLNSAEDDFVRHDLWMEYSIKKDYTVLSPDLLGQKLYDFLSDLDAKNIIESKAILYTEEIMALIYENCLELDPQDSFSSLSTEGVSLLSELMNRNVGTVYIDY